MFRRQSKLQASYREKPPTRQTIIEREKALASIHNVALSRLGTTLLSNSQDDRVFAAQVHELTQQDDQMQSQVNKNKKQLVQRIRLLPNPTILLERLPSRSDLSAANVWYAKEVQEGIDGVKDILGGRERVPRYQQPIKRKVKPPSTLPTVDAFKVERTTKGNPWDDVAKKRPHLKSLHVPFKKLSREEQLMIYKRNAMYRQRQNSLLTMSYVGSMNKLKDVQKYSGEYLAVRNDLMTTGQDEEPTTERDTFQKAGDSDTFITAIPAREESIASKTSKSKKSVSFVPAGSNKEYSKSPPKRHKVIVVVRPNSATTPRQADSLFHCIGKRLKSPGDHVQTNRHTHKSVQNHYKDKTVDVEEREKEDEIRVMSDRQMVAGIAP